MAATLDAITTEALKLAAAGFSVIPINPKKLPAVSTWKEAQERIYALPLIKRDFPGKSGLAVLGGQASGGLLIIDFDQDKNNEALEKVDLERDFIQPWLDNIAHVIDPRLLPRQRTGGNGAQFFVRCPNPGHNTKLARVAADNKKGWIAVIETRGEGGYAAIPPSRHESGNTYQWEHLDLLSVPTLTQEQIDVLFEVAMDLNRYEPPLDDYQERKLTLRYKTTRPPGEDVFAKFNERYTPGEILERNGYIRVGHKYLSPDSSSGNPGVTVFKDAPLIFSHHADALGDGKAHDAFDTFAILEHGGDKKKARAAAAEDLGITIVASKSTRAKLRNAPEEVTYNFGLNIDTSRYALNETGVFPVRLRKIDNEWTEVVDYQTPIAGRPIWPECIGRDITKDHQTFVRLAWINAGGNKRTQWVAHGQLNERATLMSLDGAPVSYGRFSRLTDWLADALGYITAPEVSIFSRPYWQNGAFIQPGHSNLEYIGPELPAKGTLGGWIAGLTELTALKEDAYPAYVALGFSAISPIVGIINKRRPIILYSHPSTSGKGTIINYATSIWDNHENRMLAAGSTWKGIQDTAVAIPDYPVFVDEAQQLLKRHPNILEDLLYFFGNGKRRNLSSPEQIAKGGEARNGVSFFAAETPVLDSREAGSQNRVIQIRVPPLPPASPQLAARLERITRSNYGIIGQHLSNHLVDVDQDYITRIDTTTVKVQQTFPQLRGDDATNITLMRYGLLYLQEVTGVELPIDQVVVWLAKQIMEQRNSIIDRQTACLKTLLQTIYSQAWLERDAFGKEYPTDVLKIQQEYVAFRGSTVKLYVPVEVNPNSRLVHNILKRYELDNPGPDWATRGWIETPSKGRHLTWLKKIDGVINGRVWRFTSAALKIAEIIEEEDANDAE